MIQIHFLRPDGSRQTLATEPGQNLMSAATGANVRGIEGDCGGSLTCATCHVMIDEPWLGRPPAPVADERDMLDFAASPVEPGSRLACQILLHPGLDGMEVRLPLRQY